MADNGSSHEKGNTCVIKVRGFMYVLCADNGLLHVLLVLMRVHTRSYTLNHTNTQARTSQTLTGTHAHSTKSLTHTLN